MHQADVVIIGAGVVGLATAYQLGRQYPDRRIIVVDKEPRVAFHQTGRNSGVIHSGIYYKPGSQKALNCRAGKAELIEFCRQEGVAFDICGKVIVAVDESEVAALHRIFERGQANGVACRMISKAELNELEPHVAGVQAIHVTETGIVDYPGLCEKLAEKITARGGVIRLGCCVTGVKTEHGRMIVETDGNPIDTNYLVNCGGLHSDRLAKLTGAKVAAKIVPFRGEYFELRPEAKHLCRNLIYPTPDPKFPFLGVHFTRMVGGGVECGPNAVLAFAREGYTLSTVNFRDLAESLTYPGFLRMAARHWRTGCGELWRSISKAAFVRALQRLMPEIQADNLSAAPAGVRAQAVSRDGTLVDDFLIEESERVVNVLNAPSPAATASLAIGRTIVDRLAVRFTGKAVHQAHGVPTPMSEATGHRNGNSSPHPRSPR